MSDNSKSLSRQLFDMTWPMLIGLLAMMSYQLIDSAFIGQLGAKPLAVVGYTIAIHQLIIGIQVGLGIAATTIISTAIGANNHLHAKELAGLVVGTGFFLMMIVSFALGINQQFIVKMLGANASLLPIVADYWTPWLISCWLGALLYFGSSIYRAHGKTFLPGMVMVLTSIVNLLLDPLFIFTFDMGIAGAAWATVIAFSIGCIIIYSNILKNNMISLPKYLTQIKAGVKTLFSFMTPSMLSQFTPPISALLATALVSSFGEIVIAAWGLGYRLEFFSIMIVLAMTMSLPAMIGKLKGSGDLAQIDQLVKMAALFIIVWQLVIAMILFVIAKPISTLLTNDTGVINILQDYFWFMPLSYMSLGVCMIMVSACNAIGMPAQALVISLLRLFACYLPLLWIGSQVSGITGLFIGASLGNFAAGVMSWFVYKKNMSKLQLSAA